jgi:predicted hydrocarbon binding protein
MFRGWFPGSLEYVGTLLGKRLKLTASEVQCASEGHPYCVFEVAPDVYNH